MPYLTESCMVLQMCSMALRMTGSLVSSTWCLHNTFMRSCHFLSNVIIKTQTLGGFSYLMKTSMMDLQTSTLTLSFWNMSRNGRKRS